MGPATGSVAFVASADDGIKLTVAGVVLFDALGGLDASTISGAIDMVEGELYSIVVEYVELIDDARVTLSWRYGAMAAPAVVPSASLYYTRHVADSPIEVMVYPGATDAATTTAEGDGLVGCTALVECAFVVQATDSANNHRYNDGDDSLSLIHI